MNISIPIILSKELIQHERAVLIIVSGTYSPCFAELGIFLLEALNVVLTWCILIGPILLVERVHLN